MEWIMIILIVFATTIFWALLDEKETEYQYVPIDRIEDEEKAVFLFKKEKINESSN